MVYDPERYYWSAALMSLLGQCGILGLRISIAITQTITLFVGLNLISEMFAKSKRESIKIFYFLYFNVSYG